MKTFRLSELEQLSDAVLLEAVFTDDAIEGYAGCNPANEGFSSDMPKEVQAKAHRLLIEMYIESLDSEASINQPPSGSPAAEALAEAYSIREKE